MPDEVDAYLATLDGPARTAFERVRDTALTAVPAAEQGKSYGMAALTFRGKPLLAFRAAKQHLSVFPFSGEIVEAVRGRLDGFDCSKGTIRFTAGEPLPDDVVADIVRLRVAEITASLTA
ncbi:uncharacterized protein YdhG (YjbR/CyaY superfamily) [Saccharomonospora amisosensis]|uniref:Uncharacterized protein YdhG (YjbR/CyaY superfamily) n=1 Tax=Saccharomonospora amisosensis TaxID=1128677 RepID=A0A7X5UUB8_9PSEU|nr:DUF1801 domain-containing protein [Saccharomonospora amisosensis]NIJ14402.1 uncharacterized protein YdhG (YjbR/CyaY superfamily) [Saccharomonospora amisosensis]